MYLAKSSRQLPDLPRNAVRVYCPPPSHGLWACDASELLQHLCYAKHIRIQAEKSTVSSLQKRIESELYIKFGDRDVNQAALFVQESRHF